MRCSGNPKGEDAMSKIWQEPGSSWIHSCSNTAAGIRFPAKFQVRHQQFFSGTGTGAHRERAHYHNPRVTYFYDKFAITNKKTTKLRRLPHGGFVSPAGVVSTSTWLLNGLCSAGSKGSPKRRPGHSEKLDEQQVENHVQAAHGGVAEGGGAHVAAGRERL